MSAGEQKFCSWLSNEPLAPGHLPTLLPLMIIEASFSFLDRFWGFSFVLSQVHWLSSINSCEQSPSEFLPFGLFARAIFFTVIHLFFSIRLRTALPQLLMSAFNLHHAGGSPPAEGPGPWTLERAAPVSAGEALRKTPLSFRIKRYSAPHPKASVVSEAVKTTSLEAFTPKRKDRQNSPGFDFRTINTALATAFRKM